MKVRCSIKKYIQPFERRLALQELAVLSNDVPRPSETDQKDASFYWVSTERSGPWLARRLAYWEWVETSNRYVTRQCEIESTVNAVRNGVPIDDIPGILASSGSNLPNRRVLRYGTHGIHEYRGKFFPQLVRSLMNIANLSNKSIVVDPMCGSGTTLVESVLFGARGIGLDTNPISVLMSQVKCSILTIDPALLAASYQTLRTALLEYRRPDRSLKYFDGLPVNDKAYLRRWFQEQVLADLDFVMTRVLSVPNVICRDFFRIAVSNILRKVSWQREADLRVRKDIRLDIDIDPVREFLEESGRSVRLVLAALYKSRGWSRGTFSIRDGDATKLRSELTSLLGKVDTIITSPPYATALPYLDTDRLSLSYLGVLTRPEHRARDRVMIGNREITESDRKALWQQYKSSKRAFPSSVTRLIDRIDRLNSSAEVGFRRRNLPALLFKYFSDMRLVIHECSSLLKSDGRAFFVVGDNHTIAGGRRVDIKTGELLAHVGESIGLEISSMTPMEMLVSRDIFRQNSNTSECIIEFRKPT